MLYDEVAPGPGARDSILGTGSARVRPVSGEALAVGMVLASMGGRLRGVSVRESTGAAAATVKLRDGSDATGQLVVPVSVAAGESVFAYFSDDGIDIEQGIFADLVAGSADVVIYYQFDTGTY